MNTLTDSQKVEKTVIKQHLMIEDQEFQQVEINNLLRTVVRNRIGHLGHLSQVAVLQKDKVKAVVTILQVRTEIAVR